MKSHLLRCLTALALAWPAQASTLGVAPVRLDISPAQRVAVETVRNDGEAPVQVEVRVFAWRQVDGEDVLTPTEDLMVNPGAAILPPGGSQAFRIGGRGPVAVRGEQAYRLVIQEVPALEETGAGVRTVLRLTVPVFVAADPPTVRLAWTARADRPGEVVLDARNDGNVHVKVHRLFMKAPDGSVLGEVRPATYLLPGSRRALTVPAPGLAGATVDVLAETDQGEITSRVAISTARP